MHVHHETEARLALASTTLSSHRHGLPESGHHVQLTFTKLFVDTDAREGMQEEEEHQAAPPIGSLEAVVEEQAAAEGAARQARVCFWPILTLDLQSD